MVSKLLNIQTASYLKLTDFYVNPFFEVGDLYTPFANVRIYKNDTNLYLFYPKNVNNVSCANFTNLLTLVPKLSFNESMHT
jgi:hypothetical protein